MTNPSGVRERLVRSAISLLRTRGADGFGMAELLEESGVARRSMYQHFPRGKAELLETAAREAGLRINAELDELLATLSPVEALAAWIEHWKRGLLASDFRRGCPLAAAGHSAQEYPEADAAAGVAFASFQRKIADAFVADGMADDDATRTAGVLVSAVEGAIITSRSLRSVTPLDDVVAHARLFLSRPSA